MGPDAAMAKDTTPRWVYRFENFTRAHARLSEASDAMKRGELDQLGQEGMVKRFEYTWDLAWKVLKDYLEHQRLLPEQPNPAR